MNKIDTLSLSAGNKVEEIVPIISGKVNVADYLEKQVELQPNKRAVIVPEGLNKEGRYRYSHLTFAQLLDRTNFYAHAMTGYGIGFGDRVLVGIRPGFDLVAVTFALYKMGAVPVFIDPGMGKAGLLNCVQQCQAKAMVAEFKAHLVSYLYKKYFSSVKVFINVGKFSFGKIKSLQKFKGGKEHFETADTESDDMAAILFTSGSTGAAKGVVYTHSTFAHQIKILRKTYNVTSEDLDMSIFPLFAMFAVSMGMPTVIPDMDCSKPLSADPRRICRIIHDQGVTFSFGSPTFWDKMASFSIKNNVQFPSLRSLLMAGCSVPGDLHQKFLDHLLPPGGDVYVPYGATEALPMTTFRGTEVLMMTKEKSESGAGTCVGRLTSDKLELKIIKISDEPIENWDASLLMPEGEIGEIVVKGVVVTKEYFERPEATLKSKIRQGRYVWHRMGDLGYVDSEGLLWFCGRKVDRVQVGDAELYTDQCENVFNTHELVRRSALVGWASSDSSQEAVIIIQPISKEILKNEQELAKLEKDLLELASQYKETEKIKRVLFKDGFPVDVRHNAKIKREILTEWADSVLKI
ncbi:MAG: fatty acid CoA ligase family protein [Lentisphaeraceae bacterium]|nr:fatty acid CoA ligase family protein [Lentisphaeraceae bacterium]